MDIDQKMFELEYPFYREENVVAARQIQDQIKALEVGRNRLLARVRTGITPGSVYSVKLPKHVGRICIATVEINTLGYVRVRAYRVRRDGTTYGSMMEVPYHVLKNMEKSDEG